MVNVCPGEAAVTLVYRWSTHLEGVDTYLGLQSPTVLVLNTGAWYRDDAAYRRGLERALGAVGGWQRACREERNVACPLYWRTTAPGIPHCMDFAGPAKDVAGMEDLVTRSEMRGPGLFFGNYHWADFIRQNTLALGTLASSGLTHEVLDGYEVGIQRPDTHVSAADCLHNSDPATPDAYNAILLHYLSASRTAEDIASGAKLAYDFDRTTNVNANGSDWDWDLVEGKDYPYWPLPK